MSKKSKPRNWSHLAQFKGDILFITGDKDKLCPLDQLADVQKTITTRYTSEIVPGDHSFRPKSEDAAVKLCVEWVDALRSKTDYPLKARV
jgi:surfactin synthase thioesterase subunit